MEWVSVKAGVLHPASFRAFVFLVLFFSSVPKLRSTPLVLGVCRKNYSLGRITSRWFARGQLLGWWTTLQVLARFLFRSGVLCAVHWLIYRSLYGFGISVNCSLRRNFRALTRPWGYSSGPRCVPWWSNPAFELGISFRAHWRQSLTLKKLSYLAALDLSSVFSSSFH